MSREECEKIEDDLYIKNTSYASGDDGKIVYDITHVRPVFPYRLPSSVIRHGRSWCEYEEPEKEKTIPIKEDCYYTGGGIWLASAYISKNIYVTISNEDLFCEHEEKYMGFYDRSKEDDDGSDYPCQCMIECKSIDEMTKEEKSLYNRLYKLLKDTAW